MSRPGYPKIDYHEVRTERHWVTLPNPTDPPGTQPVDSKTDVYDYYLSKYEDRIGGNTPGWPDHIQTNDYDAVYHRRRDTNVDYQTSLDGDNDYGYGQVSMVVASSGFAPGDESALDGPTIGRLYDKLLSKVISKIKNQKIHVGNFIAERAQLNRLVGDTATKFANTLFALRRGNFRQAAHLLTGSDFVRGSRVPRGIPEQWLALKYGWQPLVSDIYGLAEELAASVSQKPPQIYARSGATMELPSPGFVIPPTGGPTWPYCTAQRTGTIGGSLAISFEMVDDRVNALSRTGLINPASILWEIMPYSFVLDWILPVGNYLNNLDYSAGLRFLGGWFAYKRQINWTVKCNGGSHSFGGATQTWSGGNINMSVDVVHRSGFSEWPSVPLPHFKDPFSPTHAANGLALLATAFQRGRDSPTVWRR